VASLPAGFSARPAAAAMPAPGASFMRGYTSPFRQHALTAPLLGGPGRSPLGLRTYAAAGGKRISQNEFTEKAWEAIVSGEQ
jgi:hypothetical protein